MGAPIGIEWGMREIQFSKLASKGSVVQVLTGGSSS